jgi:general secretion pathway protein E
MKPTPLAFRILVAGGLLLALAAMVQAAEPALAAVAGGELTGFDRPTLPQPNLWALSLVKTALLLGFAVAVFVLVNWALLDVRFVQANPTPWNSVVLGGAVLGLAAAFLTPIFWVGLPLGILLFGAAAFVYAKHRNTLVAPALQVLTRAHRDRLRGRLKGEEARTDSAVGPIVGVGRDIIFMGMDDLPLRPDTRGEPQRAAFQEIERILHDAILRRASAVGYLARPHGGEVRFRISGEQTGGGDVAKPASDFVAAILKRLAGLNPDEVRKPQEGRLRAVVAGQQYELRLKTAGTVKGEQVALRIIDIAASQMRLDDVGLTAGQWETLKTALGVRPGLILLSGPKDSGLSTTLHACLRHFDRYVNNVIVFEPRVETEVENVQHILVDQEDGPAAVAEIRSRTRMEPDIVAFDSLYLPEAAQILAETAREKTVILGVRAADTTQALTNLLTLFGSSAVLAERLQLVVNQRLVRLLCPDCREAYRPNPDFLRKANLSSADVSVLYRPRTRAEVDKAGQPVVCPRCHNERYAGRSGLFELMPLDGAARDLIAHGAPASDVRMYARKLGMHNLQEEGLQRVIEGHTSIEEVLRAIKQAS